MKKATFITNAQLRAQQLVHPWKQNTPFNTREQAAKTGEGLVLFRCEFDLPEGTRAAVVRATALGMFDLRLNNQRIGINTPDGKVVDRVTMERTERKTGCVATILGNLCFKRKSRQDIVRLVASGDLEPGQLEQIKIGMEKGLTEKQLEQLINNNLSPERMAKVIAIAELDNKMND